MDRATRARVIAAANEEGAADRRRKARTAGQPHRGLLLEAAARLEKIAAEWRQIAVEEEQKAAAPVIPAPRRQCTYCDKRALPGKWECNEHDEELPAVSCAPSRPLTPGGVR